MQAPTIEQSLPVARAPLYPSMDMSNSAVNTGIMNVSGSHNMRVGVFTNSEQDDSEAIKAWMIESAGIINTAPNTPARFQDRLSKLVMDDRRFKQCTRKQKGALLLYGAPGLGKTSTMIGIIDDLTQQTPATRIACRFFKDEESPETHFPERIAMSLLLSIFAESSAPVFPECVHKLYKQRGTRSFTLKAIVSTLGIVISEEDQDCLIILDGMDECRCRTRLNELLKELKRIQENTGAGFIFTDRTSNPDWTGHFTLESFELCSEKDDMKAYITESLTCSPSPFSRGKNEALRSKAADAILIGSEDLFLLVTLNTNYIRSANTGYEITNLIEEIQNMTPGPYEDRHSFRQRVLDAAFSRYLDRVVKVGDELQGTWSWAPLILRFVRDARRPFTIAELQHALGSWEMKEKYREVYNPDLELVEICMGLINVDKDQRVQFFHTKLREYLGNHWLKKLPWCHEDLAISCLVYLSQDEFATGWCKDSQALAKRQASHPFAEYASKHWAKHLSEVDLPTMSTLQPLALKFLRSRGKVQSSWQMVRLEGPSTSSTPSDSGLRVLIIIERMKGEIADYAPCGLSGLHLICHFKLHALIPPLVESLGPNSLEERDSMERRPIFFAATATYDNGDAVLEWPDTTSDGLDVRDASSDSPLRRAAASVKCLLDAGAEPDLRDARNFSPLHQAAESGNVAVLRMLTGHQKPIDINSMTVDPSQMRIQIIKPSGRSIFSAPGRTALQLASRYGHLEFVKLLCTFGDLDAGILDGKGETAWHRAAKYDHVGVIRCLAEVKGVNLRKRSYDGRTALHLAAKYHRVNAVRCLTKLDPLLWYFEDHNCLTVDETIALGDDPTSTPMQMLETLICKPTGGSRGRTPEEVVALVNSILRRLQKRFDWSNKHQQLLEARSPAIQRPRSLGPARSIPRKTFRVQSQPPHHVHLPHHNALRRRKSTPMITERPWIGTTYTDRTRATSQPATRHETTDASRQDRFVRLFDAKNGAAVRGRLDRYLNFMPDDV